MEILVTGGNGFVGRHLVSALQERGHAVRVLVLATEDAGWLERRDVAIFRGDVRQPETLVAPMKGADAVLHLAAMMDVWRPIADYRAVNVTGTQNVCRAALDAGVQRVVHVSSSSVYGMGLGRPANEDFPLNPFSDPYPITKAEADALVQRMIREEHLPAVIVRPDQIFGPGDSLHFGHMADRVLAGRGIIVGSGHNALPFVYVTDAVAGLLLALDHEHALGHAYNITNDQPLTQVELMSAIAREVDAKPPRIHVPYKALYAAGYALERLASLSRSSRRPAITRLGVAFFGTDNRYEIGKARRELGYVPGVALREGVRRSAAWFLARESATLSTPAVGHAREQVP